MRVKVITLNTQEHYLIKVFKGLVMMPNSTVVVMITTRSLGCKTVYCASLLFVQNIGDCTVLRDIGISWNLEPRKTFDQTMLVTN